MRLFKVTLASLCVFFAIILIVYSARISIINNIADEQLNRYQLKVDCLQVGITSKFALVIDKLCIQSPKANIDINNLTLKWRYNSSIEITDIDIGDVKIVGSEYLFSHVKTPLINNKQANNESLVKQTSAAVQTTLKQIQQLRAPKVNINALSYIPFKNPNTRYYGEFSLTNDKALLSLRNVANHNIAHIELKKLQQDTSLAITSNIKLLKDFITSHQLPTTTELKNIIKNIQTSGTLVLKVKHQKDTLTLASKITKLSVTSDDGIANSDAFQLAGAFDFTGELSLGSDDNQFSNLEESDNKSNLQLTFKNHNNLSLTYATNSLLALLEKNQLPPAILTLLKNNPVDEIKLTIPNNSLLTLNDKKINLSRIELSANGEQQFHHVNLSNINADLANNDTNLPNNVIIENFTIDSSLNIAEIKDFTTNPITLHLTGSLNKSANDTSINLADTSSIIAHSILLKEANKSDNSKILMAVDNLNTSLAGSIQLLADKTTNLNIKIESRATSLVVPNTIKIKTFDIASNVNGNMENININTSVSADKVALGNMIISGPVLSPKLQIAAQALQLTDLLSLNIQLPTKIELIDGLLDYNVSGQIKNFNQLSNTPFDVSVAITSASGDIDGIWLQELNWQQHFTLLAGKITTLPSPKENLTVELIETPTPISKLSINTNWTFNKSLNFSANKLKADVLGGSFSIPKIQWPFEHGHSVDVQLHSIDLEQVLALDKKQGIVVTGDISGQLPIKYDGEKYTIENGELHNISNGLIQVIDNPAVTELKANNSQLQLAFDALQNLHYHQLSSAVSMADDGYMLLETVIKGRNPDIDNDVNLNLNLSYDLLGLLESLSITQRFEEGLIKGLQKN